MSPKLIVTHPGSAHKDDFLACCLLAHLHGVPIERRETNDDDLADVDVCVVDTGGSHDPALNNFDHHQFPKDHPPLCALSLVLQHIGLYDDALMFCAWLRPAEWLDTRGPVEAAKLMGIPREAFTSLNSPVDITILRRFAMHSELQTSNPIYQIMCMIGEDLVGYISGLRTRLDDLKQRCEYWTVKTERGNVQALFLSRTEPADKDPSFGLHQFVASEGKQDEITALIYPDRRGTGYGLTRYEDNQRLNFSQIEQCDDVKFAHKQGFVAKTVATDPARLRELLGMAIV